VTGADFDPGFAVTPTREPLGFACGPGVFGPPAELRRLDAIRRGLRDPACAGPDPVYAIAADVGHHGRAPQRLASARGLRDLEGRSARGEDGATAVTARGRTVSWRKLEVGVSRH
jgi:hypothetical protein